ncbi:MAG: cytochrome c-type biogenesis protein CcmH [Methylococcaceae bacterium]|nr:cytochrome c-type biogenesis protein CcmH [Methylococcaceae bacterium]OYV17793.1 MAG: cytochrome c-type bioproteinis protein CcmH [Methylococcaceae bacterium NSM2-1]
MKRLLFIFLLIMSSSVYAVDFRQLSDPEQQETYETLTKELRCLVCQNQTIADSNAELAADLRRQVYEMLQQGKSKQEIIQFMTDRYGDFVLYKPPFKGKTSVLWIAPVVFLLMGLITVFFFIRRKKAAANQQTKAGALETDIEKQKKIRSLLGKGDPS